MSGSSNKDSDNFLEALNALIDDQVEISTGADIEFDRSTYDNRNKNINYSKSRKRRKRKGLKWKLKGLLNSKYTGIVLLIAVILIIIMVICSAVGNKKETKAVADEPETTAVSVTPTTSYKIEGVPVIAQDELHAACETYACIMLLQYFDFDIDEFEFVDNYLITKPVYYGDDGNLYGPDMNSAYAGDIYTGFGINAPGMAKCMNNYIKTTGSKLTAYPLLDISLEELCEEYILNDIPVMVWATTYMEEPYVKSTWIVDYADEDSTTQIGDSVSWQMHEHCMVLIGFDDDNYYFCDSVSGKVSAYDKATSEERYEQIGKQAIIIK